MSEEAWHRARLIPTSGINGAEEQERRATSGLLAVMGVVEQFAVGLLRPLGAPKGKLDSYIEVPFELNDSKLYPDGLLRVSRGARTWTALVEVKTGKNELHAEQLENYLDVARDNEFDALITISNQIPPSAGQHPTPVDKRKLRKVSIHHWSWSFLLSEAVIHKEHKGVTDPEQAWILGELIRYLEHPKSGALELDDMGPNWVAVREAVASSTLRMTDKTIDEVAIRFDALLRFAGLRLGRQLGTDVMSVLSRRELNDPEIRLQTLRTALVETGQLTGALRIPSTVGPIHINADLRANQVTCHVDIDAPQEGRGTTRVNWLLRQLKETPESVRVECFAARTRGPGTTELLKTVRADPKVLIPDPAKEIKSFRVALTNKLGSKRGRGRGAFIDSVLQVVDDFYGDVVQNLKPWAPAPPRIRDAVESPPAPIDSTAQSSQDGVEITA